MFFSLSQEKPPSHHINILVCTYFFRVYLYSKIQIEFRQRFFNHSNRKDNRHLTRLIWQTWKKIRWFRVLYQSHAVKADEFNDKKSYDYILSVFYLCKWTRHLFAQHFTHQVLCILQILVSLILILFSLSLLSCLVFELLLQRATRLWSYTFCAEMIQELQSIFFLFRLLPNVSILLQSSDQQN